MEQKLIRDPGQEYLDEVLVKELNEMSFQEREALSSEIHGVNDIIKETPEFVAERLGTLFTELSNIRHKPAYDHALKQNPACVRSKSFNLMFLRSECFDASNAASRMVRFFEGKLKHFGPGSLTRSLTIEDLGDDDRACLDVGAIQWLPERDRAGRAVLCDFQNLFGRYYKYTKNLVCFYDKTSGGMAAATLKK